MTNGSGDFVIAFSTARGSAPLPNDALSPLFEATVEATEEAIYNSLFRATTVRSARRTVEALPLERVREILQRHGIAVR